MPWREEVSAYRTVVSELMCQQTQIATVIPYFERWTAKWPDFKDLAKADEATAKARKDGAAEDIKTELKARNASQLIVGNHKVELTPVAGRRSYDWKTMEKAGIDLSPFMTTGKPSERLTVE